jgi:EpsI family protein
MTPRRDFLIGAACLAAAAGAVAATPRRRVSLLGQSQLEQATPMAFGTWKGQDVSDLVAPQEPGGLASRLYNQTLQRVYSDQASGAQIMMLLAHGDTQSNELQVHRPEVCYPAFGFQISGDRHAAVSLAKGTVLPVRSLVADAPGRRECITYWTRLGQFLPVTGSEQRLDRIKTAFAGEVTDGLLARFSTDQLEPADAFPTLARFIVALLGAVAPDKRAAFVGSSLANAMRAAGA